MLAYVLLYKAALVSIEQMLIYALSMYVAIRV